ncbi:MAG TPA: hypothetical protein VI461_08490, partial [Chitinophagaceae bacterium]|nr:hypothetical protein [Chitinophagaceae bacterium]
MAKSVNTEKVTKIKVRMYRQGTGDFFLLQFRKGSTISFNMMIDCGCIKGGKKGFAPCIEDLGQMTDNVIDLLVVTHEHADHINGFEKMAEQFKAIEFKKVWFAWTEDEEDDIANDYRAHKSELGMALNQVTAKLNALMKSRYGFIFEDELGSDLMIEGKNRFVRSITAINELTNEGRLGATGKVLPTMAAQLREYNVITNKTEVEFLEPGDIRIELPGAEGMRFYILGPPRKESFLNLSEAEGESYDQREEKSQTDFAFLSAVANMDTGDGAGIFPFDPGYEVNHYNKENPIVDEYEKGDNHWRKIDADWMFSAGNLAMRYERSINNTSLALAIQFENSEKVLLFPGDAELGSWQSWHTNLEWPVKINGEIVNKKAEYFLRKTVFYKVGHHLSQNGTAKTKGLEMMSSGELTAMATLDFRKINDVWLNTMPN